MDDSANIETGPGPRALPGADSVSPPPGDLGPLGRLVGVFVRPRRTFESMRERPRFLLPLIIFLIVQSALAFALFHSGVIAEQTVAKLEAEGKDPRQIEAVQAFFEGTGGLIFNVLTAPIVSVFAIVSGAAILFFMGNLMLGARLLFRHYVSALAFSGVVQLVDQVVRVGLMVVERTYDVRLGLGNLFGDSTGPLIRALDTITDPLFLWGNAICALAVSVYARRKFGFGVLAVLPGLILGVIVMMFR